MTVPIIPMKIATWNVNSIRVRLPRLLGWLERTKPDIVCLQEIKVMDGDFPADEISKLGYLCFVNGQKTYNGVAILSLMPATDLVRAFTEGGPDVQRRILAATIQGIRMINVYVPNGSEVGSDKYEYKLDWFRRLRAFLDLSVDPNQDVLLCGDFNVAPEDRDVWDPELWRGKILFSEPEKDALREIVDWGLVDALRMHHSEGGVYTWWDYRMGAFHRGWGMRIDHILTSVSLAKRCASVEVDRNERKGDKPSDHAPVIAVFE